MEGYVSSLFMARISPSKPIPDGVHGAVEHSRVIDSRNYYANVGNGPMHQICLLER